MNTTGRHFTVDELDEAEQGASLIITDPAATERERALAAFVVLAVPRLRKSNAN